MDLPPVPQEELDLARAYAELVLKGGRVPEGEDFYRMLARYRRADPAFLQQIASADTRTPTVHDIAWRNFCSDVCPACGETKRSSKDFFGPLCWKVLTRAEQGEMWKGWYGGKNVLTYVKALAVLRSQGRKLVHG